MSLGFESFPEMHTCEGENISPRIGIDGLDESVKSLAIIIDDPDAPSGNFTHWIIWNIPPMSEIPEGVPKDAELSSPFEAVQGANSFGHIGYMGPCPPPGKLHRYIVRVNGLKEPLETLPGASRREVDSGMKGKVVMQGQAMARYGR